MAEVRMTFLEHLQELRDRVRVSLIIFVVAFGFGYAFSGDIIMAMWNDFTGHYDLGAMQPTLLATSVMSGFVSQLNVAFIVGGTCTLPVLLYELFLFIEPALHKKHKMIAIKIMASSVVLFVLGVLFVYYVMLPLMLDFFVESNAALGIRNMFAVEDFFEFVLFNLFIGGVSFQTPLIIIMANRIGILPKEWLVRSRRWTIVIILVIAGIVTPDHSIISQFVLGGVMYVLFEVAVLFSK